MLERYELLPDSMSPNEVAEKILEFLTEVRILANVDLSEVSEALCQLADRQWHTYEHLNDDVKSLLGSWVTATWNSLNLRATHGLPDRWAKERLDIVENLTSAIGMFGLQASYQVVKDTLTNDLHPDVRSEIESTIMEFGDSVADPYRNMKSADRERIVAFLKQHEGWDISILVKTVEGIESNVHVPNMCYGETDDSDVRHDAGFTIHPRGHLNFFHFGDKRIREVQIRYGEDDDVISVQYETGTWFDIACIPSTDAISGIDVDEQ